VCRQTTCRTCGKPTWAGCGAHIEQVLGHIPSNERCHGHPRAERIETRASDALHKPTWRQRLLGRAAKHG
jgi:hypothetical protein